MPLVEILFHAEMDRYFSSLPKGVQEQLIKEHHQINSSNDLYVKGEQLLNRQLSL